MVPIRVRGSYRWDLLEHVLELKYFRCVLDELGTDGAACSRKLVSGRVAGAIKSLVDARDLQFECGRLS